MHRILRAAAAHVATFVTTAVACSAAWWGWLGFHAEYDVDPATGSASGPYAPAQVVGLVLTLVAVVFVAAWLGSPPPAVVGGVAGLGLVATLDWGTAPESDGLWVIGVALVVVGASAGGVVVGLLAWWVRRPARVVRS